jgi:hypothetical protein
MAIKSAAVAAITAGRMEEENAIRDNVLLTVASDDRGPVWRLFWQPDPGRQSCLDSGFGRFCESIRASSTTHGGGADTAISVVRPNAEVLAVDD